MAAAEDAQGCGSHWHAPVWSGQARANVPIAVLEDGAVPCVH